jgi:hypothetical protein
MHLNVCIKSLPAHDTSQKCSVRRATWVTRPVKNDHQKIPRVSVCRLVLWSFKPGTYQTGSFAELTPQSFKLAAAVSSEPLVLPLMIEILVPLPASTRPVPRGDWRGLIGFPAMAHNLIKTKERNKKPWVSPPILQQLQQWQLQQGQQLPSKSSDDFVRALAIHNSWLAIPSPSDLRHKKCHIYR